MAAIPVTNIGIPSAISDTSAKYQLIIDEQILTPNYYAKYTKSFANYRLSTFINVFQGMEKTINQGFEWFETKGKTMISVGVLTAVTTPAAGATVTVALQAADYYSPLETPIRVGETVRIASNYVEGEIIEVDESTPSAITFKVRPKRVDKAFAGPTGSLVAGEKLIFGGQVDKTEASTSNDPLIPLDVRKTNSVSFMRDSWASTDWSDMADVKYTYPAQTEVMKQNGMSAYSYKGLQVTSERFFNNVEGKLAFGDVVTNTGLGKSTGTKGFITTALSDGVPLTYTSGTINPALLHSITAQMDVEGCAANATMLADIRFNQDFSDFLFSNFTAGAFVYGTGIASKDAVINYGLKEVNIDGYNLGIKKYQGFNNEAMTGRATTNDRFRNFAFIFSENMKYDPKTQTDHPTMELMYMEPSVIDAGVGTIGNGVRLWTWGGGSGRATDGTMINRVEMYTAKAFRNRAANQLITISGT
jgi:hypothetical protein